MADWTNIQFAIGFFYMTDTPQPAAPIIPDFTGLRRIATAGSAIAPLAELVENMAWAEELGQPLDKGYLKDMTRAACAVMAHTSLFNSNCARMLNRLPLMTEGRGFGADRTSTKKTIRTAWASVSHAVQLAPELLADRDVCQTLRAALGLKSRLLMSSFDMKCYGLMLGQLSGAAREPFVASAHTQNLMHHLGAWARYVSMQKPEIETAPTAIYPARLEAKARYVVQALNDRCLASQGLARTA